MKRLKVESSNLASVGYDLATRTLEVEFKSGKLYQYFDVPHYVYDDLTSGVFSAGKYFATAVKKNYQFKEVTMNEPERRFCNNCGAEWDDEGGETCPYCGSDNTEILPSEDDDEPEPVVA